MIIFGDDLYLSCFLVYCLVEFSSLYYDSVYYRYKWLVLSTCFKSF